MILLNNILATTVVAASIWGRVGAVYRNGTDSAPCESTLYCYGQILEEIQLARPFADSKTFVDMPTKKPLAEVQEAWDALEHPVKNDTNLQDFLLEYFHPAGAELTALPEEDVADLIDSVNATFLKKMNNTINQEFVGKVVQIWGNLTRAINETAVCDACEKSFIAPQRPFVVAGGRFREMYYWDSYWIIQGLLRSGGGFVNLSRNQIENFLDNVEQFGFVPNGARRYYLNRSQPPLLSQMIRIYLNFTGDLSILDRGLPLLVKEHAFFESNRSVNVPVGNQTHGLNRYIVDNNQPRPESFYEDYQQATNETFFAATGQQYPVRELAQGEQDLLYQNLASGAESGWDFSSRFLSSPWDAVENTTTFPLRSLNVINTVPVDLNSILYWNEKTIAEFFKMSGNSTEAAFWDQRARQRSDAMHALMWNEDLGTYFDYNLTANAQEVFRARDSDALPIETGGAPSNDTQITFNVAQLMPFLTGAAPPRIRNDPKAVRRAFERVSQYLDARAGGIAPTNFQSNQQWDQHSVWPPHMQILMEALRDTPATHGEADPDWVWVQDLALRLGQRYLDSAYCAWRRTGGETDASPKLGSLVDTSDDKGGIMFEKYSDNALGRAGGGGEYEVVTGFGWTNGVLIWVADTFRAQLASPPCLGVNYTFPDDAA